MILDNGDAVLVAHRRMYDCDVARFFLGRAIACEGPLLKAEGYTFVRDLSNAHIVKKKEKRVKVLSLDSPGYIVYELPGDVDIDATSITSSNGEDILQCGARHLMNLSEHTRCGQF